MSPDDFHTEINKQLQLNGIWDTRADVRKTGVFAISSQCVHGAVNLPVLRTYRSHDVDVGKTGTVFV